MAGTSPTQALQLAYTLQNPAAGLQLQQQQALAAQMMQEGSELPDPNAMVSGHVVATNPWALLAKGLERGVGAYEQRDANQKLAEMLQGGQNGSGQAGAIGNAMMGNTPSAQDIMNESVAPEWTKAQLSQRNALAEKGLQVVNGQIVPIQGYNQAVSDTARNVKGAETSVTPVDMNGHKVFMTPPGIGGVAPSTAPSGNPVVTPQSPDGRSALNDMYGTQDGTAPAPAVPGANPSTMSPKGNGGPVDIDFNNPVAVKGAETQASKSAENTAEAKKNIAAIDSTIETQIANLNRLKALSAKMPDRGPHDTEIWASKHLGKQDMSSADAEFNTLNKQMFVNGLMGSIPPGSKLDIPIVNALKGAKEVDPTLDHKSRVAVIDSHIRMLKDAQQNAYKNYGIQSGRLMQVPQPQAAPSTSGVTHVWTPNGIQPVGGQ